jgi:kinesin family protein 6/9
MVDLAGSERLKKAATGHADATTGNLAAKEQLARESKAINKSLTFLEQVVMALGSRSRAHVPHRSSRLTSVLRDSLGGNCKTVLIANVRTDEASLEETLSTLRFATRMSGVSTSASVNSEVQLTPEAELQKCYAQISELKRELVMHDQLANRSSVSYEPFNEKQRADVRQQVKEYLAADQGHIEVASLRHTHEVFAQFKALYLEQEARLEKALRVGGGGGNEAEGGMQLRASMEPNPGVEVVYVGEAVGGAGGFGVGEAPADARPSQGTIAVAREHSEYEGSVALFGTAKSFGGGDATEPPLSPTSVRGRAYAEFKQGEGRELAEALAQNKMALRDKKGEVQRLSREVNTAKHAIDEYRELLERKREHRSGQPTVTEMDADGQPVDVIDEEEFAYLSQLKVCKQKYRDAFDTLRAAKSDADYTQQVLQTCQAQLLTDFDLWTRAEFPEAVLNFTAEVECETTFGRRGGDDSGGGDILDQDEEFEAMASEQLLKRDPEAVAFMKAAKMASARSPIGGGGKMASMRRRG